MATLVEDCPRCNAKNTTFDVRGDVLVALEFNWQTQHEVFSCCRHCHKTTIFYLALDEPRLQGEFKGANLIEAYKGSANDIFRIERYISIRDADAINPPDDTPELIGRVFREGTASLAAACYNAAGAMFRLALDLTTKQLIPADGDQPNQFQRNNLAARLAWLFEIGRLPRDLEELAACVRNDGNDAAHDGNLAVEEAQDLLDFTDALLRRIFTEPARLANAARRRDERRAR